jgi:hypothetical protein
MKHLIAIILVVSIATIVVESRHNRHSGGWGRHEHECKTSCFAHCLAGTTADVNDFCNLTGLILFLVKFKLISNYLLQIRKLHMVLFKLEMIQANNKLFYTEKNYTTKSNTIKLP